MVAIRAGAIATNIVATEFFAKNGIIHPLSADLVG